MMVPRAFLFTSVSPKPFREKELPRNSSSSMNLFTAEDVSGLEVPNEAFPDAGHTNPVVIPPKRAPRITSTRNEPAAIGLRTPKNKTLTSRSSSSTLRDRPLPSSIASILEATAIPVPRRAWTVRESRRLPRGDHVQDFSRLLMGGVRSRDDHLLEGTGNTVLDILLSPPDENEKSAVGSEYEELSFSGRSMSIESMPSLDHDLDSPSSLPVPTTPGSQRSPSERKYRRPPHPQDCALDHPLLERDLSESEWESTDLPQPLFSNTGSSKSQTSRAFPRLGSTFKSNLTASLRAIKSAAQSVSTFATPSVQPDDFLTRSLFTITPEMTDDRRPPPMNEPPSPALRRYLNPIQISPAEMYAYQDYPHEKSDSRSCPVSIQMQTYHRSRGRSGRKSKVHLAGSASQDRRSLPFDPENPTFSRPREPRENSDFLRMVVLEMNMRRSGKLRDDIPTRARIWLPPRKNTQHQFANYDYDYNDNHNDTEHVIPPRWVGISA
ncbi:uncharacterized protein ACLA_015060 [Aspergillus clavatus NRRL 1]|uniref:Uncharacterized protein n=1 Tax=Aspergillus clavatus (strain ATCC 1007 / CBS 513.65 / DSM 816 / NCTC 3887 / NRRL 1 / QM 1276 / 107) TaxID=344612 RepID=A1CBF0_ASPCL|nr:uncharacterized protein ACLA_015060 [Aspergillus clavatus NRRL 1]EAW13068.1 conserved hypothetical protein [Aspergillus clavatus NRRL 1]